MDSRSDGSQISRGEPPVGVNPPALSGGNEEDTAGVDAKQASELGTGMETTTKGGPDVVDTAAATRDAAKQEDSTVIIDPDSQISAEGGSPAITKDTKAVSPIATTTTSSSSSDSTAAASQSIPTLPSTQLSESTEAASSSPAFVPISSSASASTPAPARRRPKPPSRGILKPPPPPPKPSLGNRLRDIAGAAKSLFEFDTLDYNDPAYNQSHGQSSSSLSSSAHDTGLGAVAGTGLTAAAPLASAITAFSGRLGMGLSRLVQGQTGLTGGAASPGQGQGQTHGPGQGSAMTGRSNSLPEIGSSSSGGSGFGGSSLGAGGGAGPMTSSASTSGSGSGVPTTTGIGEKARKKQPLRRATFVLPSLSITYPISSAGEPWSEKVIEERRKIETLHRSLVTASTGISYWTAAKLVVLYESACRGREERPRPGIVRALELLPPAPKVRNLRISLSPRDASAPVPASQSTAIYHYIDTPLNRHAAESLADVLLAEWGLADLRLENGMIDSDEVLKPILHALLISATLPSLSLSGNRKIRAGGWRLIAVFLKRARSLRYIDLSEMTIDKKSAEYIAQSLNCTQIHTPTTAKSSSPRSSSNDDPEHDEPGTGSNRDEENERRSRYSSCVPSAPLLRDEEEGGVDLPAAVQTLRMDGCGLRMAVLESLAIGIRSSDMRNISLRRNKIGPLGGVALALMIRDYPDTTTTSVTTTNMTASGVAMSQSQSMQQSQTIDGIRMSNQGSNDGYASYQARARKPANGTTKTTPAVVLTDDGDDGKSLPPLPGAVPSQNTPSRSTLKQDQIGTTGVGSVAMGLTNNQNGVGENGTGAGGRNTSSSMAIQRSVRALDGVDRIGRLTTLDLKTNDIRNGVGYIAQVLKRNRTLKVLNLSENKIDSGGLVALAEALKYNTVLETLDVGSNPCCGPSSEGIIALRMTFTTNTSLKRLFLPETNLTTEGAISLAEFLPEAKTLLHLDLTSNPLIATAGILALSVGLKANTVIRCLDLSIPPNSPELAELSQSILQSCIRNTELAAEISQSKLMSKSRSKSQSQSQLHSQSSSNPNANANGDSSGIANMNADTDIVHSHIKAASETIWQPIKKSTLVQNVRAAEIARADRERRELAKSLEGQAREFAYTLQPRDVVPAVKEVMDSMERWFRAGELWASSSTPNGHGYGIARKSYSGNNIYRDVRSTGWEPGELPRVEFDVLFERARALRERVVEQIQDPQAGSSRQTHQRLNGNANIEITAESQDNSLELLLGLNDDLTNLLDRGVKFEPPPRVLLPSQVMATNNASGGGIGNVNNWNHPGGTNGSSSTPPQMALPRRTSGSGPGSGSGYGAGIGPSPIGRRHSHIRIPSLEISSPNFSIGDSDNDSDAEELEVVPVGTAGVSTANASETVRSGYPDPRRASRAITSGGSSSSSATQSPRVRQNMTLAQHATNLHSSSSSPSGPAGISADLVDLSDTSRDGRAEMDLGIGMNTEDEEMAREMADELSQAMMDVHDRPGAGSQASPVEKTSRAWVEEEGEIFRKGMKLGVGVGLGVDDEDSDEDDQGQGQGQAVRAAVEMEGGKKVDLEEISGEELKLEILEAHVERSPSRGTFKESKDDEEVS